MCPVRVHVYHCAYYYEKESKLQTKLVIKALEETGNSCGILECEYCVPNNDVL